MGEYSIFCQGGSHSKEEGTKRTQNRKKNERRVEPTSTSTPGSYDLNVRTGLSNARFGETLWGFARVYSRAGLLN